MTKYSRKKEQNLKQKFKTLKYYCPHCRILFQNKDTDYQILPRLYFICNNCEKKFNNATYDKKGKQGIAYKFSLKESSSDEDIQQYIYEDIAKLWLEGYTVDDIETVTHYTRKLILEKTKEYKENNKVTYTFEKFKELLETEDDRQRYDKLDSKSMKNRRVIKALSIGCSVSQIIHILKISPNTISDAKRATYENIDKMCTRLENEKKPEEYAGEKSITKYDQKKKIPKISEQPTEYWEEYQKQAKLFKEETSLKRDHILNNPQRRTVKMNKENKTLTIFGMSPEQQKEFEGK